MKKEKPQIGARIVKPGEKIRNIGTIKFGKSRPDKTKYVLMDIEYDDKTGEELFKVGLECLEHDKEAVIEYVIKKAIKYTAQFEREGKAKADCKSHKRNKGCRK